MLIDCSDTLGELFSLLLIIDEVLYKVDDLNSKRTCSTKVDVNVSWSSFSDMALIIVINGRYTVIVI
jgi:hypothetical protein